MKILNKLFDKYPKESEPDGEVMAPHHAYVGMILTWFSFQYVWPYYPKVGATGSILGVIITADDVISHAFFKQTPLDMLWEKGIYKVVSKIE